MTISSVVVSGSEGTRNGFKLLDKKFVREVNAEVFYMEHVKSGARLVKIAANDPNKTFSIAFKTFPLSDNGAPHIMEHSVLNGSKNFPVKSPFDILQKGSLSTFMNAFTSKDFTMYPVASMNEKDYFNLMHVYLDAVFNPLIFTDPRILKQEGWHYELGNTDSAIQFKGVVYNEMKGAYSNPQRELWYQVYKNLFPDSPYGFESGGHPSSIPNLTQEEFLEYHKKFYDPENSYIFLYGDADFDEELKFIDSFYLSGYTKTGNRAEIKDQPLFNEKKRITAFYPVLEGAETKDQTYLSLSMIAGHNTDIPLTISLDILCEILVNQESAPLRIALQNEGIGQDVSASVTNYKQNVFQIVVQNANPEDKDKFEEIVNNVFMEVIENGINKKEVEGIINRLEFLLREGNDAQKGWTYINQIQPGWFFAGDPYRGLQYEAPLAEIKSSLTSPYLENILRKYLVNNTHAVILTLQPKPGLDNVNAGLVEEKLFRYKNGLTESEKKALVNQTFELVEYQKRGDTPAALASIPLLDIADINPKSEWYDLEEIEIEGTKVLFHEEFTNDVIYMNLFFDMRVIPSENIPYASLLSNLIGLLSTENHSFGDLNMELNSNTGGFYTSLASFLENMDDDFVIPKFKVSSKVMIDKISKLTELTTEILTRTKFNDKERLRNLLVRHLSQLEANIKRDGFSVASSRVASYYSRNGVFNELAHGMDYYWFITNIVKDFDQHSDEVSQKLKDVSTALFKSENVIGSVTCSREDLEAISGNLRSLFMTFTGEKPILKEWKLLPVKKNEGIVTASKVQYVVEGYNFKKLGYSWSGKMRVLSQILSTDWLQTRIRVIGGAYGGWSSVNINGFITFNSYRDPNLRETFENFSATADYLKNFTADQTAMTRYIIGTISLLDKPLTPSQRGEQAFSYYFTKRKKEDLQADRNAILSTTPLDIRNFSEFVEKAIGQKNYCVYGNEEKLNGSCELFDNLIKIDK